MKKEQLAVNDIKWKFEAARRHIPLDTLLTKSKNNMYCCDRCGSGTGKNGSYTGAVKVYPEYNDGYCFACHWYFDSVDQIALKQNLSLSEAADYAVSHYHLTRDMVTKPTKKNTGEKKQPVDYTAYYTKCADMLSMPEALEYLKKRGISEETARKFNIGFDPKADPANAPGGNGELKYPTPRIIIPVTTGHYIGRSITDAEPKKLNNLGAVTGIFNAAALANDTGICFVFEGCFDALSTIEIGYPAVAIDSTSMINRLVEAVKTLPVASTMIICMDNDDAGKNASDALVKAFSDAGIPFIVGSVSGDHNDANDALIANKEEFIKAVQAAADQARTAPIVVHDAADATEQPTKEETEQTELTPADIAKKLIKPLSEVQAEGKRYIFKPYLPLGKFSLFFADPGVGKTKAASALAALVTTGQPLCGIPCERQGKVLIFSQEDDAEDFLHTVQACGGNTDLITVINDDDEALTLLAKNKLTYDSPVVEEMIRQVQPVMVVFDPMQAYFPSGVDMNRANETAAALASVVRLAKQYDCHIMIIGHNTKAQVSFSYRFMGSQDIIGESRSGMTVVRDPERTAEQENIIIHTKTNNKRGKSIRYRIESIPGNEDYARVAWLGLEDYTERDYMQAQRKKQKETTTGEDPLSVNNPVVRTIMTLLKENPDGVALCYDDFQTAKKEITGNLLDIQIKREISKIDTWLDSKFGISVGTKPSEKLKAYYLNHELRCPSKPRDRTIAIKRSRNIEQDNQEQGIIDL